MGRLKEKERTRKMRKKRKTEKVGGDTSVDEEESADSEEEDQPASEEAAVQQHNVGATLTAISEMERASRVVDDTLSSTNQQTEQKGEGSSLIETSKKTLKMV